MAEQEKDATPFRARKAPPKTAEEEDDEVSVSDDIDDSEKNR